MVASNGMAEPSLFAARDARAIAASARRASASSVGQAGTSLSHSIRVGVGPTRPIVSA